MTWRNEDKLSWESKAIWWHESSGPRSREDHYLGMCADDIGTHVWNYLRGSQRRSKSNILDIHLVQCSEKLKSILSDSLPFTHSSNDLCSAISSFSQMVGRTWMLTGDIYFEARGGWNIDTLPRQLENARLVYLPNKSILTFGKLAFQFIPAKLIKEGKPALLSLNRRNILCFSPPNHLRAQITRIRNGLQMIGKSEDLFRQDINNMGKYGEDFKSVNKYFLEKRATITSEIGWNGRGNFQDYTTDFHASIRRIRWEIFCVAIRDSIISQISAVFSLIGSWQGENPRLVFENFPTTQILEQAWEILMNDKDGIYNLDKLLRVSYDDHEE
jgi:hypothetical protein